MNLIDMMGFISAENGSAHRGLMQDDRIARYRQAALAAREKATTAIDPKQWLQIADGWDQLAGHVEMLKLPDICQVGLPCEPRNDALQARQIEGLGR